MSEGRSEARRVRSAGGGARHQHPHDVVDHLEVHGPFRARRRRRPRGSRAPSRRASNGRGTTRPGSRRRAAAATRCAMASVASRTATRSRSRARSASTSGSFSSAVSFTRTSTAASWSRSRVKSPGSSSVPSTMFCTAAATHSSGRAVVHQRARVARAELGDLVDQLADRVAIVGEERRILHHRLEDRQLQAAHLRLGRIRDAPVGEQAVEEGGDEVGDDRVGRAQRGRHRELRAMDVGARRRAGGGAPAGGGRQPRLEAAQGLGQLGAYLDGDQARCGGPRRHIGARAAAHGGEDALERRGGRDHGGRGGSCGGGRPGPPRSRSRAPWAPRAWRIASGRRRRA